MSRPYLVGISGGIGAGKSTISKIFRILGAPFYDADTRAKELMEESENLRSAIKVLFGEESYEGRDLNRNHISSQAFHHPKLLTQLNELVHPAVQRDFEDWASRQQTAYILKEAALLFETGSHKSLDQVILVTAPKKVRINRVLQRDPHRKKDDVMAIISRQMTDEDKKKLADIVLINDGTEMLLPKVLKLHERFSNGK